MSRCSDLAEFVAHKSKVNTACISGLLLATGANDCRVHIWTLEEKIQRPLQILEGHSKPVDSVQFDAGWKHLAAGSRSGTVRQWNLEQGKVSNTFAEHRNSVPCLDFHPSEHVITTGSVDTNIKLWDDRQKSSVMTLKGHEHPITVLKHSPDGAWALAGDAGGFLKIWDLQSKKVIQSWDLGGAVNSIAFHPKEMTMACSTAQKCVKFFDLQTMDQFAQTTKDPTEIHKVLFHPSGKALLSASSSGLKSWGWDPSMRMYDHVEKPWKNVADMAMGTSSGSAGKFLYSVSLNDNVVLTSIVKLYKMDPFKMGGSSGSVITPKSHVSGKSSEAEKLDMHGLSIQGSPPPIDTKGVRAVEDPSATLSREPEESIIPKKRDHSLGLHMTAFMPEKKTVDKEKERTEMTKDHVQFRAILTRRLSKLRVLRVFWSKGDVKGTVETLVKMNDRAVAFDFLKGTEKNMKKSINLAICAMLIPILGQLAKSRFEEYITTSLRYLEFMLKGFTTVIKNTLATPAGQGSLSFEERRGKCASCQKEFLNIVPDLEPLTRKAGTVKEQAVKVLALLKTLQN